MTSHESNTCRLHSALCADVNAHKGWCQYALAAEAKGISVTSLQKLWVSYFLECTQRCVWRVYIIYGIVNNLKKLKCSCYQRLRTIPVRIKKIARRCATNTIYIVFLWSLTLRKHSTDHHWQEWCYYQLQTQQPQAFNITDNGSDIIANYRRKSIKHLI